MDIDKCGFNKYTGSMILSKHDKQNKLYPCKPQFVQIKMFFFFAGLDYMNV